MYFICTYCFTCISIIFPLFRCQEFFFVKYWNGMNTLTTMVIRDPLVRNFLIFVGRAESEPVPELRFPSRYSQLNGHYYQVFGSHPAELWSQIFRRSWSSPRSQFLRWSCSGAELYIFGWSWSDHRTPMNHGKPDRTETSGPRPIGFGLSIPDGNGHSVAGFEEALISLCKIV